MFVDRILWSPTARRRPALLLLLAAALPMLLWLGRAELWTQEGRWALICEQMQRSGDVWHPQLLGEAYYCKPVLSYWLVLATAAITGGLDELALRLPSVLAGLVAVWSTWRIGRAWLGAQQGLIAMSLLASCYAFVFWSRVASADMLHAAATVLAVAFYVDRRERTDLRSYALFGLILAAGGQLKSPAAGVMALLAIAPDLWREGRWRRHCNWRLPVGLLPAAALFTIAVTWTQQSGVDARRSGGFAALIHENVERYFAPFDHGAPFYVYFYELPRLLLPWGVWLPWVAIAAWRGRRALSPGQRQALWAAIVPFLFLLGCGSRRAYYLLPVLPLAVLPIADWMAAAPRRLAVAAVTAFCCWLGLVAWFGIAPPVVKAMVGGRHAFVERVRATAAATAPWEQWQVLACEAVPAAIFDLHGAAAPLEFEREHVAANCLPQRREVVLTRRRCLAELRAALPHAVVVEQPAMPWQRADDPDLLVALLD